MKRAFVMFVVAAMIGGFFAGLIVHSTLSHQGAVQAAGYFNQVTNIFLRLIKMIIAPLLFSTLVAGIAHMGDVAALGRVVGRDRQLAECVRKRDVCGERCGAAARIDRARAPHRLFVAAGDPFGAAMDSGVAA